MKSTKDAKGALNCALAELFCSGGLRPPSCVCMRGFGGHRPPLQEGAAGDRAAERYRSADHFGEGAETGRRVACAPRNGEGEVRVRDVVSLVDLV